MKKSFILLFLSLVFIVPCWAISREAGYDKGPIDADQITVDCSQFVQNLTCADTDVQHALETLDLLSTGGGGSTTKVVTKTANYTVTTADKFVLVNATSGGFTITLPTAIGTVGQAQIYYVKNISTNANPVTVTTSLTQTIDGTTNYITTTPNESIGVVSDNANWRLF